VPLVTQVLLLCCACAWQGWDLANRYACYYRVMQLEPYLVPRGYACIEYVCNYRGLPVVLTEVPSICTQALLVVLAIPILY